MIFLPNNCRCSNLTVHPNNWNTKKASIKIDWYVAYRFYDPKFPKPKQRSIRGMNDFKTLEERQAATRAILNDELDMLQNRAFNPISGYIEERCDDNRTDIVASTPFIDALQKAFSKMEISPESKTEIERTLKFFAKAALLVRKDDLPLIDVKRKDIKAILAACEKIKLVEKLSWSNNQFNVYRAHIGMIFSYLNREDVLEYNPVDKIEKKPIVKQIRDVLTIEQRQHIDNYLKKASPLFHRFVHIFFHSGARRNEIMRLQGCHVDLERQRYKILVKKRRQMAWVWKTIKDIAMPFWISAMQNCQPQDYVFSVGLKPGPTPINPKQITRSWRYHVKKKLNINIDFYSLKHLHTTEVLDILEDQSADSVKEIAEHNSHTSGAMVVQIYDVKRADRHGKKIKGINNSFA